MTHTATEQQIKDGEVTDVYFERTKEILKAKGLDKEVRAELMIKGLPRDWPWGILAGIEECLELLRDLPVNVRCMKEGALFHPYEPVMEISGKYLDFGQYETVLLGMLCQASGIATMAARCKKAAVGRPVISFGARRMHPSIVPMVDRNAFIGGCDGVSTELGGRLARQKPFGTMPHALILLMGDTLEASRAFHEIIEPKVNRVILIDTFNDEKIEAINIADAMGKDLFAVRLDTPGSRRGDIIRIMEEVRWELDQRGHRHVKIFLSGGLNEYMIAQYNEYADSYGVGSAISGAPIIDFSMDIIEIDGKPVAKRGKMSGSKRVFRCRKCMKTVIKPSPKRSSMCNCGGKNEEILTPVLRQGKFERGMPTAVNIRKSVLKQIEKLGLD